MQNVDSHPSPVLLRRPVAADREALAQMYARCGPETRYSRFISPLPRLPEAYLEAILGRSAGVMALVAVPAAQPDRLLAVGSCHVSQRGDTADTGLLVEDAWQRRGVGSMMLRRLADLAREQQVASLTATCLSSHTWVIRTLRTVLGPVRYGPLSVCVDVSVEL